MRGDAVFMKRRPDLERSVTLGASVRHDFMHIQPVATQHALLREFHLATVARVRFLARVRQHVSLEVALARQLQRAERALEFDATLRVHVGYVSLQAAVEREAARAVLALEGADA